MDLISQFVARYRKEYDFYEQACRMAAQVLDSNLQSTGVRAIVTSRAKNPARLEVKVRQRSVKTPYTSVEQIYNDITSANGDAGIRNRLFFVGACTWELRAKSKAWWGAGAWYDFIGRAHQIAKQRIAGPSFVGNKVLNQNEKTWVIDYPENLVPNEYRIIEGKHRYNVVISDNEGNTITLTEARPSDPKFGSAIVVGKRLTITLP